MPAAPLAPDPLLAEMLREVERSIDFQFRAMEELDDKSEQMMTLAIATLGGELAAFAYLAEHFPLATAPTTRLVFAAAVTSSLLALAAFIDAYVGWRERANPSAGPRPSWVAAKANDATWTPTDHFVSAITSHESYFAENARVMSSGRRARRIGLAALAASVVTYAGVAFYVLG